MQQSTAAVACAVLCLMACPARAQGDAEHARDHAMVARFPGYYISGYDAHEFGAHDFEIGDDKYQRVEGRYWSIDYAIKDGVKVPGPVMIARNYAAAVAKRGGTTLHEDVDESGGVVTARFSDAGTTVWLQAQMANRGEMYTLVIVEVAAMAQKVEFTAAQLRRALDENGVVALHGIFFETGKATIRPESAAALAPVGELLVASPALSLVIQGHTDNAGSASSNLELSRLRADAVKAYLVTTFGVAAARLTTAGFGDTRPVADNRTEEGRGRNRRVELVKK
jgi:outer membrane protein OmpA-like peptidoglycan-associated protein